MVTIYGFKETKKILKEPRSCQKLIALFNSKTAFVWEALTRIKKTITLFSAFSGYDLIYSETHTRVHRKQTNNQIKLRK